jgi:hypothetical protein
MDTWRHQRQVEAAGIEPSADFDVTANCVCDCENCQGCRAANALHFWCFKCRFLASLDADLQCLFARWDQLDEFAREAIAAIAPVCQKPLL